MGPAEVPGTKRLTTSQLAARFQVTPRTIQSWRDRKIIPFIRINSRCIRYDPDAVDRVLNGKPESVR